MKQLMSLQRLLQVVHNKDCEQFEYYEFEDDDYTYGMFLPLRESKWVIVYEKASHRVEISDLQ